MANFFHFCVLLILLAQLKKSMTKEDFVKFTTLLRDFRSNSSASPADAMAALLGGFDALFRPYSVQFLHGFRQVLPAVGCAERCDVCGGATDPNLAGQAAVV